MKIAKAKKIIGRIVPPGDKSISHRALIFGSMAEGKTTIKNLLKAADVESTKNALLNLGILISENGNETQVHGKGPLGFKAPKYPIDCGNSGTTMRLLMGLLAGQNFESTLIGDESLSVRPMSRIAEALGKMGAVITLKDDNFAPVSIKGFPLHGIEYSLPVASAQLKSSLIIAGLQAKGKTILTGKIKSRDHTEKLLSDFNVKIETTSSFIGIDGRTKLTPAEITVPGDPSSAAFFVGAALIVPNSCVEIENVSLNPTRIHYLNVLKRMGAKIEIEALSKQKGSEPTGNIKSYFSSLAATEIKPEEIPFLIDEIPILSIIAAFAKGKTKISGAKELRIKETDRIKAIAVNLKNMGAEVSEFEDGLIITGGNNLYGTRLNSYNDHRIAMSFTIAALASEGESELMDFDCVNISYPNFFNDIAKINTH